VVALYFVDILLSKKTKLQLFGCSCCFCLRARNAIPRYRHEYILSYPSDRVRARNAIPRYRLREEFIISEQSGYRHEYILSYPSDRVSVDEIEKRTGIDFFPNLDDATESQLEKSSSYKDWAF
jgi:DNA/RNA endonuclease G (NUC1)